MAANSPIEWTDHTFNPWWGCTKVSPGCLNCYAEALSKRFGGDIWGPGRTRRTFGGLHWGQPLRWDAAALTAGCSARVFCASMADVFERDAPEGVRKELWRLIDRTPNLDWQVLTKRPDRIASAVPPTWLQRPLDNVWFGTSIECIDYAWRLEALRQVPATIRFLSIEPLLGPIPNLPLDGVDLMIVGGESGPRARPIHRAWIVDLKRQCEAARVLFFFKQWGGKDKRAAGRALDGLHYDAMPPRRPLSGPHRAHPSMLSSEFVRHGRLSCEPASIPRAQLPGSRAVR